MQENTPRNYKNVQIRTYNDIGQSDTSVRESLIPFNLVKSRQASYLSGRQVFCAELSPSSEPTHACTAGPAGWHTSAVAWPPEPAAPGPAHLGPYVFLPPLLPFRGLPPHLQRQLYRPQGAELWLTSQLHPLAGPDTIASDGQLIQKWIFNVFFLFKSK